MWRAQIGGNTNTPNPSNISKKDTLRINVVRTKWRPTQAYLYNRSNMSNIGNLRVNVVRTNWEEAANVPNTSTKKQDRQVESQCGKNKMGANRNINIKHMQ